MVSERIELLFLHEVVSDAFDRPQHFLGAVERGTVHKNKIPATWAGNGKGGQKFGQGRGLALLPVCDPHEVTVFCVRVDELPEAVAVCLGYGLPHNKLKVAAH